MRWFECWTFCWCSTSSWDSCWFFFPTLLDLIFRLGEHCFKNWLFVHLPTVGHLGRLQVLVILRKAAVNIFMRILCGHSEGLSTVAEEGRGCVSAFSLPGSSSTPLKPGLLFWRWCPQCLRNGSSGFLSLSLKSNDYKVKVGHSPCLRPFPGPSLPWPHLAVPGDLLSSPASVLTPRGSGVGMQPNADSTVQSLQWTPLLGPPASSRELDPWVSTSVLS